MPILGLGTDLVEVQRMDRLLDRHRDRLDRIFTSGEQRYCLANPARQAEHFAARFAAKEAALKALGTGWSGGIAWTDIEVVRLPSGKPDLKVHGVARDRAVGAGIARWWVSLSHVRGYAQATVVAESETG